MSYAQIDLNFTRYSEPGETEYLLHTAINPATSFPDVVDACLVVQKGDDSLDEELIEIANMTQLISSPLPALPADVDVFSSPSLLLAQIGDLLADPIVPLAPTPIAAGDIIQISPTPDLWQQFLSASATAFFTVVDVVDTTTVTVTPPFPAFARTLSFNVTRAGTTILPVGSPVVTPTDGLANRDYSAAPVANLFLATNHVDSWTDLTVAENRIINLKADAESLIDAMNTADWTGTERAEYP